MLSEEKQAVKSKEVSSDKTDNCMPWRAAASIAMRLPAAGAVSFMFASAVR